MNSVGTRRTLRRALTVLFLVLLVAMLLSLSAELEKHVRKFGCDDFGGYIRERLEYRKKRIKEACRLYGYETFKYKWLGDVQVDNIVWTRLPKVATTYMTTIFLRRMMRNATLTCSPTECHTLLEAATAGSKRLLDGMIGSRPDGPGGSLLIVRRPYARLVSAYLDKIARNDGMGLWADIGRVAGRTNSTVPPTFVEFVDFVIWQDANDQLMDGHWDSQERLSRVCYRDYQYIVQLETLQQEMPYVLRQLGLQREARHPVTERNSHPAGYDVSQYMDQLDERQTERLDAIFRLDIILFNG